MQITPHPVLAIPTPDQLAAIVAAQGEAAALKFLADRERAIALEKHDPLRHGYEPAKTFGKLRWLIDTMHANDILVSGGNRSGKTEICAKIFCETLVNTPGARGWALQETDPASIDRLQPYVYRYLPPEWRDLGKQGKTTYIKYTRKTGFSDSSFVLPHDSFGRFMNYAMDTKNFEGEELDVAWLDELAPPEIAKTIRYRLATRDGLFLLSFTPLEGYTVTVKEYLEGARVLESLPAPLLPQDRVLVPGCPKGHMPYVMECAKPGRYVIFFFAEYNPYSEYQNLVKVLREAKLDEIQCRAYGWPSRLITGAFPKFGDVHIIPADKIPAEGTNYFVIDPAGGRNWFMLWIRVDAAGRAYVYREWPGANIGDWAEPSDKHDGKAGPAQRLGAGRGIVEYKRLILELESAASVPEGIHLRLIDPRAGANQVPGIDEGTSLIELFADEQQGKDNAIIGPSMYLLAAPGGRIEEGVTLINDWLSYDTDKPVDALNCPRLFVSAACKNLIYALRTWTGADGEKGASKDPIDALRYACKESLDYLDTTTPAPQGQGVY